MVHGSDDPWRRCSISALWYILNAMLWVYMISYARAGFEQEKVARFSVNLDAFGGMNTTAATGCMVSPWFNLTAKVENPRARQAWCCAGGEVVVSYDGVSLAWGRVPGFCGGIDCSSLLCLSNCRYRPFLLLWWGRVPDFCVLRKGELELTLAAVAAAGKGIGLSNDSRRRFAAKRNSGTAQVVAEMKLFYHGNGWWRDLYAYQGVSLLSRNLVLHNHDASHVLLLDL
ncbi:hypothetical protein PR202_ga06687 [Eleusine coracana subsp. coracana]|uniref:Uncharacterized protein n=1 Tax=Eleusine coracana subsp. coracana TaxID=191504 RepID=A0AAV5BXM2_ELECO|nr:hypothetical protein PR202_ga06687 [Eleusine coracana subsp. coracana]